MLRSDLGCEPWLPSCLTCPLVERRFDVAGGLPQAVLLTLDAGIELSTGVTDLSTARTAERETERNAAVVRMRDAGRSAIEIGKVHGLTKSQVNRVLQKARAAR